MFAGYGGDDVKVTDLGKRSGEQEESDHGGIDTGINQLRHTKVRAALPLDWGVLGRFRGPQRTTKAPKDDARITYYAKKAALPVC